MINKQCIFDLLCLTLYDAIDTHYFISAVGSYHNCLGEGKSYYDNAINQSYDFLDFIVLKNYFTIGKPFASEVPGKTVFRPWNDVVTSNLERAKNDLKKLQKINSMDKDIYVEQWEIDSFWLDATEKGKRIRDVLVKRKWESPIKDHY